MLGVPPMTCFISLMFWAAIAHAGPSSSAPAPVQAIMNEVRPLVEAHMMEALEARLTERFAELRTSDFEGAQIRMAAAVASVERLTVELRASDEASYRVSARPQVEVVEELRRELETALLLDAAYGAALGWRYPSNWHRVADAAAYGAVVGGALPLAILLSCVDTSSPANRIIIGTTLLTALIGFFSHLDVLQDGSDGGLLRFVSAQWYWSRFKAWRATAARRAALAAVRAQALEGRGSESLPQLYARLSCPWLLTSAKRVRVEAPAEAEPAEENREEARGTTPQRVR